MERVPIRRVILGTSLRGPENQPRRVEPSARITSMLSRPSWSVRSMLPPKETTPEAVGISRDQLHHLLKLSALPKPKSQEQEDKMLKTLADQIHFVKEVQNINTTNIEPLVAIRDETDHAVKEQTITLEKMQQFLDQEDKVGRNGTIRRRRPTSMIKDSGWDPFDLGAGKESRKKGRYFFVKRSKDMGGAHSPPTPG